METVFSFNLIFLGKLPYLFLQYWYQETPFKIIRFWAKFLLALEHFLSFTLAIKTIFQPWRNERRKGFFIYAVAIAFTLKLFLIFFDLAVLLFFLTLGLFTLLFWLILPIFSIILIFIPFKPF